ncbi:uncharacterized protein A4U43_C01F36350 [Asparagus officinalis]|uniref:DYW domain-containing protein n=2 Tax=Asparagus officinalis TaxID=4686 RepID=A0A5P1FW92_ASPOF|nr:uncharacterized protein A4U43_C01F36350 [Asparagus officinalis]
MPQTNLVSWTALIAGYSHHGFHPQCFHLFSSMLPHHLPNDFALSTVLGSCAKSAQSLLGRQVHALASKTSFDANVFVGNALITMYSSCDGHGDDGWSVFCALPFRNLITWNSMLAGFFLMGKPERSLQLFTHMNTNDVGLDRATVLAVVSSCCSLLQCSQMLSLAIKACYDSQAEVGTALIKAYSSLGGDFKDCYRIFSGIKERDIVAWTAIITSCADHEPEEAILLFCRLRQEGFRPDRYTLSAAVKACAVLATERQCLVFHSCIFRFGFPDDTVLSNALIHAYSRSGSISLAEKVFKEMGVRDQVSWNSIIKAYAAHGRCREALLAFEHMDISPDSATFIGLLTACSHGGLLLEGRNLFKAMSQVYGVEPQLDHYACMVDILGRAGKLEEAEKLVDEMPTEADPVVWSSLLGACWKHGEDKIGGRAAQKLVEMDPHKSAGYVMLSNIYSAKGSFGDAASVRKEMKKIGVKKEPGLSWIAVGNQVHEFSAGGRRHPQIEAIYVELRGLVSRLKEMGYVADTKLVLHEIEEKYKEERLLHHSEKLALVFGLMNASTYLGHLRIMKNIRICEDCHKFIKLASKCVEKEIVVRDSKRFHHFTSGECSCGDYW